MKRNAVFLVTSSLCAMLLCGGGCAGSAYRDPGGEGLTSRKVGFHDIDLVVAEMVRSMLDKGLAKPDGGKPVIVFAEVFNNTPGNINTKMLMELIREAVLKAEVAEFTAATDEGHEGGEPGNLYRQLLFQAESGHVREDTVKSYGQFVGADYILYGNVYGDEIRRGGTTQADHRFVLTLVNIESAKVFWTASKPIRKILR